MATAVLGFLGACSQLPNPDLSNIKPEEAVDIFTANCREAEVPARCYSERQRRSQGQRGLNF